VGPPDEGVPLPSIAQELGRLWGCGVSLEALPAGVPGPGRAGFWLAPILDYRQNLNLVRTTHPALEAAIERGLRRSPDLILALDPPTMVPLLRTATGGVPIAFDVTDVPRIRFRREIPLRQGVLRRILWRLHLPALTRFERRAIARADLVLTCSGHDRDQITRRGGENRVAVVPNAVAIPEAPPPASEPSLLFAGSLDYPPNADAVRRLLELIWPRVRAAIPGARLRIAGPGAASTGTAEGVERTGWVEDLDALYRRTAVVCVPLRAGSGTRLKILEAGAYGRAIVATAIAAEGLELRDGHELLLREDPGAFADACVQLLRDGARARRLGAAARRAVSERYARPRVVALARQRLAALAPSAADC
jgi:glycosyltransferase involved in cell wall biosynthesis